MRYLNLGILAHVDAGKTTLTERLLYTTGIISAMGSVDHGNTQTDTLALERQRGITIKAAVVSFVVGDVTVNLIDTPGHPDFIAEVERVLHVLDGVVLVVSAVEGVQPQTRVLMRTLQRLRIPTLLFVNKIDRAGADIDRVLRAIAEKLSPAIAPMAAVGAPGFREAYVTPYAAADAVFRSRLIDLLAERNDSLLAAYLEDEAGISHQRLIDELTTQTRQAQVFPIFFGSAITGAGADALIDGIITLLPAAKTDAAGPVAGAAFKIERGPAGEKIAYVRFFSGTVAVRDRLTYGDTEGRVTALRVFERGSALRGDTCSAGQIAKLWGLNDIRIGDMIGSVATHSERHYFAPPTLETVVAPRRPIERRALHTALTQLAEQDPLINLRQSEQELYVSLYGEVQKEVIQATLANEYGIDVEFRETTIICVERPVAYGEAIEVMGKAPNPCAATVGLRIEPGPINSGLEYRLALETHGKMPLAFFKAVEESVRETLRQGLFGWQVTDCLVTLTQVGYDSVGSTAGDFRILAPLVLAAALQQAETQVYEPIHRFALELPTDTVGRALPALMKLRAAPGVPLAHGALSILEGEIPAQTVHEMQQQLPSLTRGEGALEYAFERYEPIRGAPPIRPRSDHNPLNRKEYLLHVLRRV